MHEPPHDPECHRAVAAAGNVAQVQNQTARSTQLLERRIERSYGGLLADRVVEADQSEIPRQPPHGQRAGVAIELAFHGQRYVAAVPPGIADGKGALLVGAASQQREQCPGSGLRILIVDSARQTRGDRRIKRRTTHLRHLITRYDSGAPCIAARSHRDHPPHLSGRHRPDVSEGRHGQPAIGVARAYLRVEIVQLIERCGDNGCQRLLGGGRVHRWGIAFLPGQPRLLSLIGPRVVFRDVLDEFLEVRLAVGECEFRRPKHPWHPRTLASWQRRYVCAC